jgi:hypothetical protein
MAKTMNRIIGIEPSLLDDKIKGTSLFSGTNTKNLPWQKGVVRLKAEDAVQPIEVDKVVLYLKRGILAPAVPLDGRDLDLVHETAILVQPDEEAILSKAIDPEYREQLKESSKLRI